ncbi:MAG: helix-turn-helix domain-containing protein, partial [Clostridia bacterium]|nr:helix-turn-helix domain-containing protein [Clostridia bacterium]
MELLLNCLKDRLLPEEKREMVLAALCRRETAELQHALNGENTALFALPKEVAPLLFFVVDGQEFPEEQRAARCDALRALRPHTALAAGEENIVFCCHCPQEERETLLCALAELLKTWGCRGAVSKPVSEGSFLKQLELVRLTLELSGQVRGEQPLARFEEHASMVMFALLQEHMPLAVYHAEEALQVIQQDYENNTDLSRSLYGYLSCFFDLKEASGKMGIHRNTIAYHIRKI